MNWADFLFGALVGFMLAAWLAYRRQARERHRQENAYQRVRSEILRLLERVKDLTEVRITIRDETGELKIETDELDPVPKPKKDLH